MELNLAILFVFYWVSIFSCLGYGKLVSKYVLNNGNFENYGYVGLLGVLSIIIYAYISNFFYTHNQLHNSLFILIGFLSFLYFAYSGDFEKKK